MRKCIPGLLALLSLFFIITPLQAAGAAIIRVPGDFATIADAAEAAEPGSMLIVAPGSYTENIIIKKPLFLRTSRGAQKTIIKAANPDKPVIHITGAENVTILGLTLKDSLIAGVLAEKTKGLKIMLNTIKNNENGVIILASKKGIIFGNIIDSNNSYGLYINESSRFHVRANSISRNNDKGLFLFDSHDNRILKNKVNLNTWNGMLIWSSDNNVIRGNKTLRNMFGFVTGESKNNEVADNTSLPDLFLILPVFLIYIGFLFYLIQMYFFRVIYGNVR